MATAPSPPTEVTPLVVREIDGKIEEVAASYDNGDPGCLHYTACCPIRFVWFFITGIVGTIFLLFLLINTAFMIFIFFLGFLLCCSPCRQSKTNTFKPFLRRRIGDARLSLETTRDSNIIVKICTFWHFRNLIIGWCQTVEYVSYSLATDFTGLHEKYFDVYNDGNYPFLYGVVETNREKCMDMLYAEDNIRDNFFSNCESAPGFIQYPFPQSMSTNDDVYQMALDVTWMLIDNVYRDIPNDELFRQITPGCEFDILEKAWNNALFYRLFGGRMTLEEVSHYQKEKPCILFGHLPYFPFHFSFGGGAIWRRSMAIRKWTSLMIVKKRVPRLREIIQLSEEKNYDVNHAIRAAVYLYMIAGGPVVLMNLFDRFEKDESLKDLFRQNPLQFILEILRTSSPVSFSAQLAQNEREMEFDGSVYRVPQGTSIGVGLWALNRDSNVFPDPMKLELNRPNQGENVVFARLYDENRPAPRGCPGRQLGPEMLVECFTRWVG